VGYVERDEPEMNREDIVTLLTIRGIRGPRIVNASYEPR
jgi:hypothetical protein